MRPYRRERAEDDALWDGKVGQPRADAAWALAVPGQMSVVSIPPILLPNSLSRHPAPCVTEIHNKRVLRSVSPSPGFSEHRRSR